MLIEFASNEFFAFIHEGLESSKDIIDDSQDDYLNNLSNMMG